METKSMKEWVGTLTCLLSFVFGFGLCIAGFCVPPVGEIDGSVLWVLGQSLLYCGSFLGIAEHYRAKTKEFENEIRTKFDIRSESDIPKK